MTTNNMIKLILGLVLLALILPASGLVGSAYFVLPTIVKWVVIIVLALVGLKLIVDAIGRL